MDRSGGSRRAYLSRTPAGYRATGSDASPLLAALLGAYHQPHPKGSQRQHHKQCGGAKAAACSRCCQHHGRRLTPDRAHERTYPLLMFNHGQRAAVEASFRLAGFARVPELAEVDSEDERLFVIDSAPSDHMLRDLEQVLQQLLGLKVAVLQRSQSFSPRTRPF